MNYARLIATIISTTSLVHYAAEQHIPLLTFERIFLVHQEEGSSEETTHHCTGKIIKQNDEQLYFKTYNFFQREADNKFHPYAAAPIIYCLSKHDEENLLLYALTQSKDYTINVLAIIKEKKTNISIKNSISSEMSIDTHNKYPVSRAINLKSTNPCYSDLSWYEMFDQNEKLVTFDAYKDNHKQLSLYIPQHKISFDNPSLFINILFQLESRNGVISYPLCWKINKINRNFMCNLENLFRKIIFFQECWPLEGVEPTPLCLHNKKDYSRFNSYFLPFEEESDIEETQEGVQQSHKNFIKENISWLISSFFRK